MCITSWYQKNQWKPFWLAIQLYLQNDWTGCKFRVDDDVFAQAPFCFGVN